MIEINLATYDKQNEILRKLNEGGEGYFYLLASADSTAMPTDIEALKGLKNIKSIVNSEAAMRAVINSSTAMEAVANSTTAMGVVLNSSTAMRAVLNSSTAMEAVANSTTAMGVVAKSSTAMEAVAKSSTAMEALLNSKNTRTLGEQKTITGKFLPVKANYAVDTLLAYNGTWSAIGTELGSWLLKNSSNPIATQIKHSSSYDDSTIYYYDLNA